MRTWIVLLGVLATYLVGDSLLRSRDRKVAKTRSAYGLEDFVAFFSPEDIPAHLPAQVHAYFQSLQSVNGFPVHPTDALYKVYGIWNEDLDDAVLELAARCDCKTPLTEDVQNLPRVRKVEDLVRLLSRLRRQR